MARRIAYLINQYPAISQTFIRREIDALERLGFEVDRIALRGWDAELVDERDAAERKRTHYVLRAGAIGLLVASFAVLVTRPRRFIRAMACAIRMGWRADRPLLIHFAYLAEACKIILRLRARSVQHLHAHFSTNPAEIALLVRVLGGPPWSFTAHGIATLENPSFTHLREKLSHSAFAIAVCSFARGQLLRFADVKDWPKVHVIRCGLDQEYFELEADIPQSARLVCVGRLCNAKAQLLLLDAARIVASKLPNFELVLVGDGDLKSEIERKIRQLNLDRCVKLTGALDNAQVLKELIKARALVLPSFAEGLPVVIMEAMACRRPIISTYVAGIPELVVPGAHGWLVPSGDEVLLADAMIECLHAPAERLERMGEAARARVMERHNIDREALKLISLFGKT